MNKVLIVLLFLTFHPIESVLHMSTKEPIVLRQFQVDKGLALVVDSLLKGDEYVKLDINEHYLLTSSYFPTLHYIQKDIDSSLDFYALTKEFSFNFLKYSDSMIGYVEVNNIFIFLIISSDRMDYFKPTGIQKEFKFINLEALSFEEQEQVLDRNVESRKITEFTMINNQFVMLATLGF